MVQGLTREFIESFYRARLSRDEARVGPYLDDDVDWLITGPIELLQFCGHRRGKAKVLDIIVRLMPRSCMLAGRAGDAADRRRSRRDLQPADRVQCGTGRIISYHQAQFLQFRDGKIVEYRAIIDSFDAAEQMMGHPIALPICRRLEDGDGSQFSDAGSPLARLRARGAARTDPCLALDSSIGERSEAVFDGYARE